MADMPAGFADTGEGAADAGADRHRAVSLRRWIVIGAIAAGSVAMLLDALVVNAFGVPGVLAAFGLVGIGAAVLYGVSGSHADRLSRSPQAAADALTALPEPCYVTDRRGAILFANEAYRELAG
ncbi:MAG: PAS domain-containing protein, partial [Parvibaculum sp.]|nr:PAS domain-containing protein [Parvibaculum sp.]